MIAKIWAKAIIEGTRTFAQVPAKLKEQVTALLKEAGREDLVA